MKNKKIAIIIALAVVVFFAIKVGKDKVTVGNNTSETKEESFTGKLKDALGSLVPVKCEWKEGENSGVVWVKDKKMYNEMTTAGKKSYAVIKDNCLWSWGDETKDGFKMCWEQKEGDDITKSIQDLGQSSLNTNTNYVCKPGVFDEGKLTPPTTIKFMDLNTIQKSLGQ